jgi:hypothetical protein
MAEEQVENLELDRKMAIALYYVNGDEERAKHMVEGNLKDICAIKGRFNSTANTGSFILFYNHMIPFLTHVFILVTSAHTPHGVKTKSDWRGFEKFINEGRGKAYDELLTKTIKDKIQMKFSLHIMKELNAFIEGNELVAMNRFFQNLLQDIIKQQKIDVTVDYEMISSLVMEMESISSKKIDLEAIAQNKEKKIAGLEEVVKQSEDEFQVGRDDVKIILKCALILSPIKGKDISTVLPGDRIRLSIVERGPKAVSVAELMQAYVNGQFLPVAGTVKLAKYEVGTGYIIYAEIIKGVIAKVIEAESNIKIATDMEEEKRMEEDARSYRHLIWIVIAVICFILMIWSLRIFL